jgi:hypothetical protein
MEVAVREGIERVTAQVMRSERLPQTDSLRIAVLQFPDDGPGEPQPGGQRRGQ